MTECSDNHDNDHILSFVVVKEKRRDDDDDVEDKFRIIGLVFYLVVERVIVVFICFLVVLVRDLGLFKKLLLLLNARDVWICRFIQLIEITNKKNSIYLFSG